MKKKNLSLLVCPNCGSEKFDLDDYNCRENAIDDGRLICASCRIWYRIENGILDFVPLTLRRNDLYMKFANKYKIPLESLKNKMEIQREKSPQMEFFKENFEAYEKDVVNSKYYKTLDLVAFVGWVKRNLKPGNIVLDLGCGTGRQCIPMAQQGINAVGIDISEEMLLLAKGKIEDHGLAEYVDLIVADIATLPFKDRVFNACLFYGTLHHLSDKHQAIAATSEKIVDNGLFYSLDPNDSLIRFVFDFFMKLWKLYENEDADEKHLLSKKQLKQWLFDAGITSEVKYSTYLPPHLFYLSSPAINKNLLKLSDRIFNNIPLVRDLGGVIIAEGVKNGIMGDE